MKKVIPALITAVLAVPCSAWGTPLPQVEIIEGASSSSSRALPSVEHVNGSSGDHHSTTTLAYLEHTALPLSRERRGIQRIEGEESTSGSEPPSTRRAGTNQGMEAAFLDTSVSVASPLASVAEPSAEPPAEPPAELSSTGAAVEYQSSEIVDNLLRSATARRLTLSADQRSGAPWFGHLDTGIPLRTDIGPDEVWVHISVEEQSLVVMRGDQRQKAIDYVSLGANGVSAVRQRGSRMTPEGEFRIDHINTQSQFHRFFRIDYPNPSVADKALAEGVIDQSTRDYIHRYYAQHNRAPMDTPLGGHLGIHGLGNKDAYAHSRTNWTDGCKAVTNEEIRALEPWLALGTRVIIE